MQLQSIEKYRLVPDECAKGKPDGNRYLSVDMHVHLSCYRLGCRGRCPCTYIAWTGAMACRGEGKGSETGAGHGGRQERRIRRIVSARSMMENKKQNGCLVGHVRPVGDTHRIAVSTGNVKEVVKNGGSEKASAT